MNFIFSIDLPETPVKVKVFRLLKFTDTLIFVCLDVKRMKD